MQFLSRILAAAAASATSNNCGEGMSRRLVTIIALCLLVATGCVKQQRQDLAYYHPHKSFALWEEDLDHCHYSVKALKNSDRLLQDSYAAGVEKCMEAKGYIYGFRPYPQPPSAEGMYLPEGAVYTLLDSTWHSVKLAQKRADYLEGTGVWSTAVRSWDSGTAGVWQQVLVGSYDTLQEAREARRRLVQSHGLSDLRIVMR